jgi:hypothetical protein
MLTEHTTSLPPADSRPYGVALSAIAGALVVNRSIRANRSFDPTVAA